MASSDPSGEATVPDGVVPVEAVPADPAVAEQDDIGPDGGFDLSGEEVRVLGCLVEKQLTTPQQYPLSLNALTSACNQSSNRDPVVAYDEATVEAAVRHAKQRGLARFVHPSHGRSVLRYEHLLGEVLGLDRPQLALLAMLMLRGPQTVGELRARTDRMADFADLSDVVHDLGLLAGSAVPRVVRLPRRPGQKEDRFAQCLAAGGADAVATGGADAVATGHGSTIAGHGSGVAAEADRTRAAPQGAPTPLPAGGGTEPDLRAEVEGLRRELATVRRDLDELRTELGLA